MAVRRHDPERRGRIIESALAVIARDGVAGCTHRSVAAEADVPLGSMTYYFESRHDLIEQAFALMAQRMHADWAAALAAADSAVAALEVLVDWVHAQAYTSGGQLEPMMELYVYAARRPQARRLISDWMDRVQQALARFFPADTAKALDAVVEGVMLHNVYAETPLARGHVAQMLQRVAGVQAF
jgi:DNA-binding transcriptional regulator YbjK